MNLKKTENADLERKRSIFFSIGLIIALGLALYALDFQSNAKVLYSQNQGIVIEQIDDLPPITKPKQLEKPKVELPSKFEPIIDDKIDEDIPEYLGSEIQEDEPLEPVEATVEEPSEPMEYYAVEYLPRFKKYSNITDRDLQDKYFKQEIFKHVNNVFSYPERAKERGVEGRVIVAFLIDERGKISDITVFRGIDPDLDKEAVRIVEQIPELIPAMQRGKAVKMRFVLPITFKLQ